MQKRTFRNAVFVLTALLLGAGCTAATSFDVDETRDLSQSGLTEVPAEIFTQTDLVELDLSGNALTGSLPGEIRFVTALQVLDVSDNMMTGVPAEIGQLRNLRTLDLSNNALTGLPLELGQLTELVTLDLRGNAYAAYDLERIRSQLTKTNILVDEYVL